MNPLGTSSPLAQKSGVTTDTSIKIKTERSYLQWPEVVEWFLPPAVVADSGQHGLGGHSCSGQHLHGLGCGPVEQVSRCPHGGACGRGASLRTEATGWTKKTQHDRHVILSCPCSNSHPALRLYLFVCKWKSSIRGSSVIATSVLLYETKGQILSWGLLSADVVLDEVVFCFLLGTWEKHFNKCGALCVCHFICISWKGITICTVQGPACKTYSQYFVLQPHKVL